MNPPPNVPNVSATSKKHLSPHQLQSTSPTRLPTSEFPIFITTMTTPPPPASRSPSPSPTEDIAAVMGFGSFGHKPNPPKKKRKLADPNSEGSGSNNTPLGVRSRKLGDQVGEGEPEGQDVGPGQTYSQVRDLGQRYEGQRIAGTRGAGIGGAAHPTISNHRNQLPDRPPVPVLGGFGMDDDYNTGQPFDTCMMHAEPMAVTQMPARTQQSSTIMSGPGAGRRADGQWDWGALSKGVRDEVGDLAFYNRSFVEDPWRRLRGGEGQAVGTEGG